MPPPAAVPRRERTPRFKFIWGGAKQQPGRWYVGLLGVFARGEGRRDGIAVSGRGLIAWCAVLLVAGYIACASLLYVILWSRNPYNILTYTDALLYPVRRAAIQEKKGQQFIAQGMDLWRGQKIHAAASLLRLGLDRYPRDLRARTMLAQYYTLLNRRPLALTVLQDGLGSEYPGRAYLQTIFNLAEQGEDYALILKLCDRFRPGLAGESQMRERRWLQTRQFAALLGAGRETDALALANEEAEWSDLAGEQRVMALLAAHRSEEAVKVLEQWRARPGADVKLVDRLLVRAYREAKQFDAMERAIEELRQQTPTLPAPVVYGIVQRAMAGLTDAARRTLDQYLARFGRSSPDLQLVAEPLLEIGEIELVERVAQAAAERGYPAQPFQVMLVQGNVQRGRWPEAERVFRDMKVPQGTTREAQAGQTWHTWMKVLLEAATVPNDTAQVALIEFLRSRPWPMKIYRLSIEALRQADRLSSERSAIELALVAFPASSWLQKRNEEVTRLIAAQTLPAVSNKVAEKPRWIEAPFFEQLDGLLRDAKWVEADDLIADVRKLQPPLPWVDRRDDRLRLAQVRIAHGRGRTAEMLASARVYLTGDNERARVMLDVAREIYARGDKSAAIALAQEVKRKYLDYPPVNRLLAEWVPAGKGK